MATVVAPFLAVLAQVLQSEVLVALFVLGIGALLFCLFVTFVFVSVWALAAAWAGYENDTGADEFDEDAILPLLAAQAVALWTTLAALVATLADAAGAVASGVFNNLTALVIMLIAFIFIIQWDTWHNVLLQAAAETYTCFVAPVVRTLWLPLVNILAVVVGAVLPLLNAVRQLWSSITTLALLDVLVCGSGTLIALITEIFKAIVGNLGETGPPTGILAAIVQWLQLPAGGGSPLDVGINLFPSGHAVGMAIASLARFSDCLCAPASEIVIEPLFRPFTTDSFAQLFNATGNLVPLPMLPVLSPVFITQGVLRPIVRTAQNAQNASIGGDFSAVFSRPSFNSTFTVAEQLVVSGGEFVDEYGVALYTIANNIVREIISTCPDRPPWLVAKRCAADLPDAGTCMQQRCFAPFPLRRGCCVSNEGVQCAPGVSPSTCAAVGVTGEYFEGQPCAPFVGCLMGCCARNATTSGAQTIAGLCADDQPASTCTGPGTRYFAAKTCASVPRSTLVCKAQAPLTTYATDISVCSDEFCTGSGACTCDRCRCTYEVASMPAVNASASATSYGPCQTGTDSTPNPDDPGAECRLPVPIDLPPPVPALVTGVVYLTVDAFAIQPLRYAFNIVWNIDIVLSTLDGYLYWRINDSIGAAARKGGRAIESFFVWLGEWFVELGNTISAQMPMRVAPSQTAAARSMALTFQQRRALDSEFTTADTLVQEAFRVVNDYIAAVGHLVYALVEALISTLEFVVDQFFGTIYFTVNTGINSSFPDPFAYGKITWGDTAPPGFIYDCVAPTAPSPSVPSILFRGYVSARDDATCNDRSTMLQYCRFVFARALASEPGDSPPTSIKPSFITLTFEASDIPALATACVDRVNNCAPAILLTDTGGADAQLAINQYEVLLEKYVDVVRTLDPLVSTWCDGCEDFQRFFSGFVEPFVPLVLLIIDPIVHTIEIFSSGYLACLDVQGVGQAVNQFVTHLTDILRAINDLITGVRCEAGVGARDSRILCVLAQGVDSLVNVLVQIVLLVWRIVQALVLIFEGALPADALLDTISFQQIELAVRDVSFAVFGVLFQIIPRTVTCKPVLNTNVGCCVIISAPILNLANRVTSCAAEKTADSCSKLLADVRSEAPTFISDSVFFPGESCARADANNAAFECFSQPGSWEMGCCQTRNALDPTSTTAAACMNEATRSPTFGVGRLFNTCPDNPAKRLFFPGQTCAEASLSPDGLRCPPVEGPVQQVLAAAFSTIVADIVLVIPRVLLDTLLAFVRILATTGPVVDPFEALISAFFTPIFQVLSDFFVQMGRVFGCAGATEIKNAFSTIASVIDTILCIGIEILADLVKLVLYFVFGIIELVTTLTFTILGLALKSFFDLLLRLSFAIFGSTFVCGLQNVLCLLDYIPIAGITDDDVNFAVNQCRILDCCAIPPIEPGGTGTSTPDCFPTTGVIQTCADAPADSCPRTDCTRKRCAYRRLDLFTDLSDDARKRSDAVPPLVDMAPSEAFCGGYLAQMGIERARAATNDSVAQQCLRAVYRDRLADERRSFRAALAAELEPARVFLTNARTAIGEHWSDLRERAHENVALEDAALEAARDGVHNIVYEYRIATLLKKHHNLEHAPYARKRSAATASRHRAAYSDLLDRHWIPITHQALVDTMMVAIRLHRGLVQRSEHRTVQAWAGSLLSDGIEHRKRALPHHAAGTTPTRVQTMVLAIRLAVTALGTAVRRITTPLDAWAGALLRRAVAAQSPHRSLDTASESRRRQRALERVVGVPVLSTQFEHRFGRAGAFEPLISNDTLAGIGGTTCNETEQFLCTGCEILDNFLGAAEDVTLGLAAFYPNETTGYLSYVERSKEGFANTLESPVGTDTYTTMPKRTPWLFERLPETQWFWQWNYTELIDIVTSGGTAMPDEFVNKTRSTQLERALRVGRVDYDNTIFDLFGVIIEPAITLGERLVGALAGAPVAQVIVALYDRYVACDYQGALQCQSDLGVGLFDALANVIVVSLLTIIILGQLLPGSFTLLVMVIVAISYFLTMWIAYGASPLCTLPTLFPLPIVMVGVPGVPTCLPIDFYTLNAELFPQCSPTIPTALIEPAALPAASTTLCASCGTAPPLQNCADGAGFLNGLDNFFYMTAKYLDPSFNQRIAETFTVVLPVIGERAALYTPAYVEQLGEIGAVCNRVLLPNLVTAAAIVAIIGALAAVVIGALLFFLLAGFWLYWVTLLAASALLVQMDRGFVQGTRVRKLDTQ